MIRKSTLFTLTAFLLITVACGLIHDKPIILVSKEYNKRFEYWPTMGEATAVIMDMYRINPA